MLRLIVSHIDTNSNLGVDHSRKRGMQSKEDPDKHHQGGQDGRRDPKNDPVRDVAAAQRSSQRPQPDVHSNRDPRQYYYYDTGGRA